MKSSLMHAAASIKLSLHLFTVLFTVLEINMKYLYHLLEP